MIFDNLKIGVMQGRLLPKYRGKYQAHPVGYWHEEFSIAASLELDCIEFIIDYHDFEKNPLIYSGGVNQILELSKQTGVEIHSICADYFMESSFFSNDKSKISENIKILKHLIQISSYLGIKNIVIPCVDQSSLKTYEDKIKFVENISPCLEEAKNNSVHLALETDLNPLDFINLINLFSHESIKVNYDLGNSAALGFNIFDEFEYYGKFITDIHIKDRTLNGSSVELGTGNASINDLLSCIHKINYNGILIMQAYRDDEGLSIFKKQLNYLKNVIINYNESIND